MKGFLTALQFLTIVRISDDGELTEEQFGNSMAYFPLIGLCIGLVLVGIRSVLVLVLPPSLADVLVIVTLVIITGSLHLDGFADTIDGLAGGRDRKKILAIMRDSRIGSFAVVGLILILSLKILALIELPEDIKNRTLLVLPVLGRWSTVQLASFFKYARSDSGMAKAFTQFAGPLEYLIASLITGLVVAGVFLLKGFIIMLVVAALTFLVGLFFRQRIGGVTGDIMGASCELSEVITLLVLCAFFV